MGQFDGKVALITGGSTGIGFATAQKFIAEGARVVIAGRNVERGEAAAEDLRAAGGEAIFVQTDVSQDEQVENLVKTTIETFGGLDYAFNNAGAIFIAPIGNTSERTWDSIIDINLKGVWLSMKHEIAYMLQNGGGVIVNTSSVVGDKGVAGMSAYAASKHGVNGLTKSLALEYAEAGIRINTVMPGPIETPMLDVAQEMMPGVGQMLLGQIPVKRFGRADEIADAVLWLCSDGASYITGTNLPIDGGFIEA